MSKAFVFLVSLTSAKNLLEKVVAVVIRRQGEGEKLDFDVFFRVAFTNKEGNLQEWKLPLGVKFDGDGKLIDGFHSDCVRIIGCLAENARLRREKVFPFPNRTKDV